MLLKIHYRTKKLEKILSNDRLIKKHYSKIDSSIKNRLTELSSVSNLSMITNLPPPRKHRLSGNYQNCWAVDVSPNYRLVFSSYFENIVEDIDVREIVIESIEDYH